MARQSAALFILLLAAALVVPGLAAWPGQAYYIEPNQVDLIHILAPPPAPYSDQGKADLRAVLALQRTRTEGQVKEAQADSDESVFRFADVMGPRFRRDNLPFATVFFQRVSADSDAPVAIAKEYFNRPRPFVVDFRIKPVVARSRSPGYPGGHATFAYVNAILLAYMVPEKAPAIFARAERFARNRVIGGVHYPSDSEAGRICASVIDNVLLHNPRFWIDFMRARAEVRHAIGLSGKAAAADSYQPAREAGLVATNPGGAHRGDHPTIGQVRIAQNRSADH